MRLSKDKTARILSSSALLLALAYSAWLLIQVFLLGSLFPAQRVLIMAGLLGAVSLLVTSPGARRTYRTKNFLLTWMLIISIGASISLQLVFGANEVDVYGRSSWGYSAFSALLIVTWLMIGMASAKVRLISRKLNPMGLFIAAAVLGLVFLQRGYGFQVDYSSINGLLDTAVDHTTLQDSAVLLMLFAYSRTGTGVRVLVAIAALVALFMLGGRATFFLFAFSILFSMWAHGWRTSAFLGVVLGGTFLFGTFAFLKDSAWVPEGLARMLFFDGLTADASQLARHEIFLTSISDLPGQIAIGDPGSIVRSFGSIGMYIHNIISVWQFYGLIPFTILLILVFGIVQYAFQNKPLAKVGADPFGYAGLAYALSSILIAKSLMFGLFWFFIGYWVVKSSTRAQAAVNSSGFVDRV